MAKLNFSSAFSSRTPAGLEDYLMSLLPWQRALPEGCLNGKTILVTGVQYMSIGGAAVHGLASHCGANVILHGYCQKEIDAVFGFIRGSGNKTQYHSYVVDFESPDQAWELGGRIVRDHGAPFAVLNIAGITQYPDITKLGPNTDETAMVERILNVNYISPLRLIGSLVNAMVEAHKEELPRILCTSSVHSERACSPGNATYATSKNGQECIVRDLANDPRFAGRLVAVALEFGWIDVIRHRANDEIFQAMKSAMESMPTRRIPTASEAALQYAKLLMPDSIGCHGATYRYDSGRSIICP